MYPQMNPLYYGEVKRHIFALRECLVRHDENIKAHTLMSECVPYFLAGDENIEEQLADQAKMTEHLRDPEIYAAYYANNPHEAFFEDMFGGTVEDCVERGQLPRVTWLIEQLNILKPKYVLDVACNDGAIAKYVQDHTETSISGLDLNPVQVKKCRERGIEAIIGTIEDVQGPYDAIYAMEVIEHVPDPTQFLRRLAERAPHVYITTPLGATENGNVPNWRSVEHKGHVRAVIPPDLKKWGEDANLQVDFVGLTHTSIIVAHYSRG